MPIHRLSELLKERGAKISLANALNKPPSVISDLCAGRDRLNDDLIEAICNALKIPVWQLFVDPRDLIPPEYIALMDDYNALDPDARRIVESMLLMARMNKKTEASEKKITRPKTRTRSRT